LNGLTLTGGFNTFAGGGIANQRYLLDFVVGHTQPQETLHLKCNPAGPLATGDAAVISVAADSYHAPFALSSGK
jgi:hypothetical protein